jgi:hypothetical protein
MSAFVPYAAMVSAARHLALAPSGNWSKALRAAQIHEIGLVAGILLFSLTECCQI